MTDQLPAAIIMQILFMLLTSFCTGAEAAICCVNDYRMREFAKEGNRKALRVLRIMEKETKILSAMQTGIFAFSISGAAAGVWCFTKLLIEKAHMPLGWTLFIVVLAEIIMMSAVGDKIPKKLCTSKPDKSAMNMSAGILAMATLLGPLSSSLNAFSKLFVALSGNDPDGEVENVTEDEIRMMVDLGSEKGTIAPEEKELITNIFEFGDHNAEDVMTHRKDVTVLMRDETVEEWESKVRESGYSRFPVCGEDIDDIVGVVYARELYEFLYDKGSDIQEIIHQAYIVPETLGTDVLFRNMQKEKTHFAIVADEYGGFAGIITMDDLLSEIVGEIEDEEYSEDDEEEKDEIIKICDDEWDVDGMTDLEELGELVGIELPTDEFDTLSGLVLDSIDYVPDDGATIDVVTNGLKITANEIKDRRIVRATVKKLA